MLDRDHPLKDLQGILLGAAIGLALWVLVIVAIYGFDWPKPGRVECVEYQSDRVPVQERCP